MSEQTENATNNEQQKNGAANETTEKQEEMPDIKQLISELEALKKRTKEAEHTISTVRSENAKLKGEKREQMTAAEQLAAREKELADREADLQRRANKTAAKEALAALNLSDKELSEDDLELFVSTDEQRTASRCKIFADIVRKRELAAAKAEREKVLKEMPQPPAGDPKNNNAKDPFEERLKKYENLRRA